MVRSTLYRMPISEKAPDRLRQIAARWKSNGCMKKSGRFWWARCRRRLFAQDDNRRAVVGCRQPNFSPSRLRDLQSEAPGVKSERASQVASEQVCGGEPG